MCLKKNDSDIIFIAYLQIIGIILVVFGHSFHEFPDGSHGKTLLIYRLCYNFRMPTFMFVSGFLMYLTGFMRGKKVAFCDFAKKKIMRLLVPYACLTLVTFVPRAMMSTMADDVITIDWTNFFAAFIITDKLPIPFFWFIQASFILLLVCFGLLKILQRAGVADILGIIFLLSLAIILPQIELGSKNYFGYKDAIRLAIYFVAGIVYCRYMPIIDHSIHPSNWIFLVICICLWLILFFVGENIGNQAMESMASFAGIGMCVSIAKLMEKHRITVLDHLKGTNYIIFLLSWYFNVLFQQVLAHYVVIQWWVHTLLSLFFGIYGPWIVYKIMERNQDKPSMRIFARLLGQNFRHKS